MKSVLLIRNDRLGDLMLALPCGEALRRAWPSCDVSVLAAAPYAPLLRTIPWVHRVIEDSPGKPVSALVSEIEKLGPQAALFLYPRPKTAWAVFRAGVPLRIGPVGRWYFPLFSRRLALHRSRYDRHEADFNLDLVRALGVEASLSQASIRPSEESRGRAQKILVDLGLPGRSLVLIHPGSGGSSPTWGAERFHDLARALKSRNFSVAITAGPGEEGLASDVSRGLHPVISGLPLLDMAALLSLSQLVVAGSTGVLHLASVCGAPVVGLYSGLPASTPLRWAPLGKSRVLAAKRLQDPGLETIAVADVVEAVEGLIR